MPTERSAASNPELRSHRQRHALNKVFVYQQLVRFAHCDPAGIVYFPWFLDMAHSAKEDWFGQGLGYSHFDLIRERRIGTPTVNLQCDFVRTVEMGQVMQWELRVARIGNASVQLSLAGMDAGEACVKLLQTIVFMNLDTRKAIPIPADLRPRIEEYLIA
jgi:4-hydroxybenzoyl-CoA thioesterase